MLEYHWIYCPFCGERFEIGVDPAATGQMIQDCDVCCRPIALSIHGTEPGERQVTAERGA